MSSLRRNRLIAHRHKSLARISLEIEKTLWVTFKKQNGDISNSKYIKKESIFNILDVLSVCVWYLGIICVKKSRSNNKMFTIRTNGLNHCKSKRNERNEENLCSK